MRRFVFVVAAMLVPVTSAMAGPVALEYRPVAVTPNGAWSDYGVDQGSVEVLEARVGTYTVSVLTGPAWCSPRACPVRIFEGGQQVLYVEACTNTNTHTIDGKGRVFVACGEASRLD